MDPEHEQLAQLISGVSDSLHREFVALQREMHEGFARLGERINQKETRLDRHGALLQTGARWSARMVKWTEDVDQKQEERDKRIADLEKRVRNLERKKNGH